MNDQITIRSRDEAALHLHTSRLWEEPGFVPWVRGRRVRVKARFPRWLQTVSRSDGLPAVLPDARFAPRRAKT